MVSLHPDDLKEAWFLHRKVSVDEWGWHEEIDLKYAETLIKQQGQENARFHRVPGHKQEEKRDCPTSTRATSGRNLTERLNAKEHTHFRGGAGLAQYMQDRRGDLSFATRDPANRC